MRHLIVCIDLIHELINESYSPSIRGTGSNCKQKQINRRFRVLPEHFPVLVEAADLGQERVLHPSRVREDGSQGGLRTLVPHHVVYGLNDAPENEKKCL